MKPLTMKSNALGKMQNLSITSVLLLLVLFLTRCNEEPTHMTNSYEEPIATIRNSAHNEPSSDNFTTPLFGLATSPNNDILVADAGAGVSRLMGTTEIPLLGVTDIAPIGNGTMWAVTGALGGEAGATTDTGQGLYRISKGQAHLIVNLFAFEQANDPDGAGVDSNPYAVASLGGNAALVVDAGGNDLLRVDNQGNVEVIAVFPDELVSTANLQSLIGCPDPIIPGLAFICDVPMMPAQAVPTTVVVGPDGYYYVGELKGFPGPAGASNIWKISPNASGTECGSGPDCMKVFNGGFTSIIDLAFGPDGMLYVAELDEQSWFAVEVLGGGVGGTINACDLSTLVSQEVASGIPMLTAITFGKDGTLWATENALIPGAAQVIEIPL